MSLEQGHLLLLLQTLFSRTFAYLMALKIKGFFLCGAEGEWAYCPVRSGVPLAIGAPRLCRCHTPAMSVLTLLLFMFVISAPVFERQKQSSAKCRFTLQKPVTARDGPGRG